MNPSLFHKLTLLAIVWASLHNTGFAVSYIRPNESKELFQLEKIPLQVNNMKEVSSLLIVIALRPQDDSAVQRRASAQLLALAMRLDPLNQDARKMDKAFSVGHLKKNTTADQVLKAQSKLRFYNKWLSNSEAGTQANKLANYLTDATKTLYPETSGNDDIANWTGVLPNLDQYPGMPETDTKIEETPPEEDEKKMADDETPTPKETPTPAAKASQFYISELELRSPLKTDESKKHKDPITGEDKYTTITRFEITPIKLKLSTHSKNDQFTISFSPSLPWIDEEDQRKAALKKLTKPVITALKTRHKDLPHNSATVSVGPGKYAQFNYQSITAPMAVMLEASLRNQPLRNDLHICASIDSQGKITQPKNFWKLIEILRKNDSGGRLIISSESAELMAQLLVFEEPHFFTRWEVFTAKNLDQAMEIAINSGSKNTREANALFKSIQTLAKKTDVTKLSVNRAVRKRLAEILTLSPNHLSASILLLQGSGRRPMRLSELGLAHEISPILASIGKKLSSINDDNLPSPEKLKTTHAQLREEIDPLEKLVDRSSGELYQKTLQLINDYRRLISISRRISSDSSNRHSLKKTSHSLISSILSECVVLQEQIQKIITQGQ